VTSGVRAVLAGGGTAGHVEPALATADALRRADPDAQIVLLGTENGLEQRLVPARGYRLATIPRVPMPRRPSLDLVRLPGRLLGAVRAAGQVMDELQANVVVGFGGFVATPAYLAARRRGIPIVVHEANTRPGLANRLGVRWAARVATGFPDTPLPRAELIGLPLRRSLTTLDRTRDRAQARLALGLEPDRPTVLVFGGSQGATSLNRTVPAVAARIADAGGQTLLASGRGRADEAWSAAPSDIARDELALTVVDYLDRMDLAYTAADVAVVRSGAMTVAEMTALGLPAIYVPLPIGNGEQAINAAPVVAAGGGAMIRDEELTADTLADLVLPLLTNSQTRARMGSAAAKFGRRDADDALAAMAREVIDG
jgi:UDP-N-acetylglucosamine--N-acetylmuramyl-(pentapeptide) pyrophosphoryl-undecaprenol N-acetylglucosamine transferase